MLGEVELLGVYDDVCVTDDETLGEIELLGVHDGVTDNDDETEGVMEGDDETEGVMEGVPVGDACATCATDTFWTTSFNDEIAPAA